MKKVKVFSISIIILFLVAAFIHLMNVAPDQQLSSSSGNLSLAMNQKIYPVSSDKIVLNLTNEGEKEILTSKNFVLEKKFLNVWYKVPLKSDMTDAIGVAAIPGETVQLELLVSDLKNEPTPGKYRAKAGSSAVSFEFVK